MFRQLLPNLTIPYLPFPGMISPEQMHHIWKEAAGGSGEEGLKGAQNGLGALVNGTSLAGTNPLLQGSMLGLNGLSAEGFPFAGLTVFSLLLTLNNFSLNSTLVSKVVYF